MTIRPRPGTTRAVASSAAVRAQWGRISGAVERHGLSGTARIIAERTLYLRETHFWYELDLSRERRPRPLAEGLSFVDAGRQPDGLIDQIPDLTHEAARERLDRGATLWLVLEGDRVAFACWTFVGQAPALAAPDGWLDLPDGVHCLEDSVTTPEFRGRGIAPAAWAALADRLRDQGVTSIVTKVAVENVASCRAVAKSGFEHVATMELQRVGRWGRVAVSQSGSGAGPRLAERLER